MTEELKKESKVDLYLSKVEEKVLTNASKGTEEAVVSIPTDFTIEEVKEIMRRIRYFKLFSKLSYAKELPTEKFVIIEVRTLPYECQYDFNLFIHWN